MFLLICRRWKRALTLILWVFLDCIYILFNLVLSMQASQIRDKYKRILEEPEQEDSDDEWEIAYSHMNRQRKKKILTETNSNCPSNGQFSENSHSTLALKQKLAQCLSNCKTHCKDIEQYKQNQLLFDEERADWRREEGELNRLIEEEKTEAKMHLSQVKEFENENRQLARKCQEILVEKDLQQKQTDFYKSELGQLKVELQKRDREFKHCEKEFRSFEKLKRENVYLQGNVQRLSLLIEDSMRFGRVSGELMKKHFLGKPHKEMDYWYPQHLVGEVEHFLKKSQVGYGNRQFTTNLIKFIEKVTEKTKEEPSRKYSSSCSKPKERDSMSLKKSHKLHTLDCSSKKTSYTSNLKDEHNAMRTHSNSFWKASDSRVTHSQTVQVSLSTVKSQCWDVVNEFRSIVCELLLEREVKRKKIKKLVDSMSSSLMELFDSHTHMREISFALDKNDFNSLRFVTEEATAPLK